MKKSILSFITASLCSLTQTFAQDCCYTNAGSDFLGFDAILLYDIGGGYRQDNLQWKIYPELVPDTEVKEKWSQLQIGIIETNAQFLACEHFLFRFDFDYGWFQNGGNQTITDEDLINNRVVEKLKSETRGHVYNIDGSIGYQFNFCSYRYAFTPLVGYSYHFQKLKNDKYEDTLVDDAEKEKIKNSYRFRWRGATVGFVTSVQVDPYWQWYFLYNYHWVRFRGKVLEQFAEDSRTDHLKSNGGYGNEFMLGTTYEFCPDWMLGLKVDYKSFYGHKGTYKNVIIDPYSGKEKIYSPLRDLSWNSINATIDIIYIF